MEQQTKREMNVKVEGEESIVDSGMTEVDESSDYVEFADNAGLFIHAGLLEVQRTDDYNNTTILETVAKIPIKRKLEDSDSVLSTSKEAQKDAVESPPNDWAMWKPGSLKSKNPALCQPKEKRPYDKLAEAKFEMVVLQRRILGQEIEKQMLMKQAIEDEMRQKFEMHTMQKKLKKLEEIKLLLETEIMRTDLKKKTCHK